MGVNLNAVMAPTERDEEEVLAEEARTQLTRMYGDALAKTSKSLVEAITALQAAYNLIEDLKTTVPQGDSK